MPAYTFATGPSRPLFAPSFAALTLFALTLSTTAIAADPPPASLCQRLAPQLGMTGDENDESGHQLSVNLLGGLGTALFGGSTSATFSLAMPGVTAGQGHSACLTNGKGGILCKLSWPARLTIGTKRGEAVVSAALGERAEVEMRKSHIYCRDLPADPAAANPPPASPPSSSPPSDPPANP